MKFIEVAQERKKKHREKIYLIINSILCFTSSSTRSDRKMVMSIHIPSDKLIRLFKLISQYQKLMTTKKAIKVVQYHQSVGCVTHSTRRMHFLSN